MKRFVFFLFALLFIGVGIEAKTVPAYLDVGLSEFVINDCSEGVTIGETMVILDLDFYIFQAGYGQVATVEIGEYKLLPFLANQTEGVLYYNLIAEGENDNLHSGLLESQEKITNNRQMRVWYGFGQINRWTITEFSKV